MNARAITLLLLIAPALSAWAAKERYGPGEVVPGNGGQLPQGNLQRMTPVQRTFMERAAKAAVLLVPRRALTSVEGGANVGIAPVMMCPNAFADAETGAVSQGGCSAALVGRDLLLTAAHCVRDMTMQSGSIDTSKVRALFRFPASPPGSSQVFVPQGDIREIAEVLYCAESATSDLALLRLSAPAPNDIDELKLSPAAPKSGEAVHLMSFPLAMPLRFSTCIGQSGKCSQATVTTVQASWFRAPLDSYPGSSGGAVLDDGGDIMGVFHGGAASGQWLEKRSCRVDCVYSMQCKGDPVSRVDAGIAALIAQPPAPVLACTQAGRLPPGPACPPTQKWFFLERDHRSGDCPIDLKQLVAKP